MHLCSLYSPVNKGHIWDWESKQQAAFRKHNTGETHWSSGHLLSRATIWVRCECDSGRYGLDIVAETTERENTPVTLASALEGGTSLIYFHRTIASSCTHRALPSRASHTAADAAASGLSLEQSGRWLVVNSLHWQLGCSKGLALRPGQWKIKVWMLINKPLWEEKSVKRHLGLSARAWGSPQSFPFPAHKAPISRSWCHSSV